MNRLHEYFSLSKRMMKAINHQASLPLCIVLLSLCTSCITITGLTDGYDKLTTTNKEHVCYLRDSKTTDAMTTGTIYLVSASELKQIIEKSDKRYQIVYEYNPNCPSDVCIPISTFVSLCEKYDAEPIVLMRYLDNALFDLSVGDIPLYGIDHGMYKPRAVYKYVPLYLTDLTGNEIMDDGSGNLFVFEKGSFKIRTDINSIGNWYNSAGADLQ